MLSSSLSRGFSRRLNKEIRLKYVWMEDMGDKGTSDTMPAVLVVQEAGDDGSNRGYVCNCPWFGLTAQAQQT